MRDKSNDQLKTSDRALDNEIDSSGVASLHTEVDPSKQAEFIMQLLQDPNLPNIIEKNDVYLHEFDGGVYPITIKKKVNETDPDNKANITSYIIKFSDDAYKGKKSPYFGTNGEIEVKLLGDPNPNQPGYDLATTQDFVDRGQLMINAARELYPAYKSKYDKIEEKFKEDIAIYCKLDIDQMRDENKRDNYFEKRYENAQVILSDLLLDLGEVSYSGKRDKKHIMNEVDKIKKMEIDLTTKNGRPVIFKADLNSKDDNKLFSMQIPVGKKTVPSSDRTGNYKEETLLSNHVRDVTGTVNWAEPNDVKPLMVLDGHSSYPTIGISNDKKRKENASSAVREKLMTLTRDYIASHTVNNGEEITISWTAMMLLSPLLSKRMDKFARGKESEFDQMMESADAMDSVDGQKFALKTLLDEFNIDDPNLRKLEDVKITADINYMDIAVNVLAFVSNGATRQYTKLNEKGFKKYTHNVIDHLKNELDSGKSIDPDLRKMIESVIKNYQNPEEVIELLNKFEKNISNGSFNDNKELLNFSKRFLETLHLFNDKNYQNDPYLFVTRFLEVNKAMGRDIEAFCKSAEDRTGWARVRIMADQMFFKEYGRDPIFDKEKPYDMNKSDKEKYDAICAKACELSASIENTRYNSQARGMQIGGNNVLKLVASLNKKIAVLAKKPFKAAEKRFNAWNKKKSSERAQSVSQKSNGSDHHLIKQQSDSALYQRKNTITEPNRRSSFTLGSRKLSDKDLNSRRASIAESKDSEQSQNENALVIADTPNIKGQSKFAFYSVIESMCTKAAYEGINSTDREKRVSITTKNENQFSVEENNGLIHVKNTRNMPASVNGKDCILDDYLRIVNDISQSKVTSVEIQSGTPQQQYELLKMFVDNDIHVSSFDRKDVIISLGKAEQSNWKTLMDKNKQLGSESSANANVENKIVVNASKNESKTTNDKIEIEPPRRLRTMG